MSIPRTRDFHHGLLASTTMLLCCSAAAAARATDQQEHPQAPSGSANCQKVSARRGLCGARVVRESVHVARCPSLKASIPDSPGAAAAEAGVPESEQVEKRRPPSRPRPALGRRRRHPSGSRRAASSSPAPTASRSAAYLAELHDQGPGAPASASAVAVACFRARLAGDPSPAGERTAQVLADLGQGSESEAVAFELGRLGFLRRTAERPRRPWATSGSVRLRRPGRVTG